MRLTCPWCGPRDVSEFSYVGDASVTRPDLSETSQEVWHAYIYQRDNPMGRHREYWHHERGCRQWLIADRDTRTHQILATCLIGKEARP